MNTDTLSYQHIFQPATQSGAPPLLLLHGTGGDERDLLPLGRALSPGSALLSPRGDVNERGQLRFFRRLAEGVFDLEDVVKRTNALADFIVQAVKRYELQGQGLVAVGFSNGANIAATLLQLRPEALDGALLLRAMVVLDQPAAPRSLIGKRVFIAAGAQDPIVPLDHPARLGRLLEAGGAKVNLRVRETAGHHLAPADISEGQAWLQASHA